MGDVLNYQLIYEAANNDFSGWRTIGSGIFFIIIGAALVISPTLRSAFGRGRSEKFLKLLAYTFLGFSTLWTLLTGSGMFLDYRSVKSASENNTCNIVEGRIENFQPMIQGEANFEKFRLNNVSFEYSDYHLTGGFNNTSAHGGPITEGQRVRVCYFRRNGTPSNIIVRLEIAQ